MATIKSFTSLEQSKVLADVLPIESADMCWIKIDDDESFDGSWETVPKNSSLIAKDDEPLFCWSLAALLKTLNFPSLIQNKEDEWEVYVFDYNSYDYIEKIASNPIDACYEMILKLHEQNLL